MTVLIVLVLSLIFLWLYSFTFYKSNSNPSQKKLKALRNKIIGTLKSLSEDEKEVLREYLNKNKKTLEANFSNKVVLSLEHRGILVRLAVIGDLPMHAPYTVDDTCWELIKDDRGLIQ